MWSKLTTKKQQTLTIFEKQFYLRERPNSQIPKYACPISHNTPIRNRNVHISVPKWCIVGYHSGTAVWWDLWDWSIMSASFYIVKPCWISPSSRMIRYIRRDMARSRWVLLVYRRAGIDPVNSHSGHCRVARRCTWRQKLTHWSLGDVAIILKA